MTDSMVEHGRVLVSHDAEKQSDLISKRYGGESIVISEVPESHDPFVNATHDSSKLDLLAQRLTAWLAKQGLEGHG
jgi:hypothetical protein